MAERREAKSAKLRIKIFQIFIFDAKLRFALLASLRSAIFSETEMVNKLVTFPARVNSNFFQELARRSVRESLPELRRSGDHKNIPIPPKLAKYCSNYGLSSDVRNKASYRYKNKLAEEQGTVNFRFARILSFYFFWTFFSKIRIFQLFLETFLFCILETISYIEDSSEFSLEISNRVDMNSFMCRSLIRFSRFNYINFLIFGGL